MPAALAMPAQEERAQLAARPPQSPPGHCGLRSHHPQRSSFGKFSLSRVGSHQGWGALQRRTQQRISLYRCRLWGSIPLPQEQIPSPASTPPASGNSLQAVLLAGRDVPGGGIPPSPHVGCHPAHCSAGTLREAGGAGKRHDSHFQLPSDKTLKPKQIRSRAKTPVINTVEAGQPRVNRRYPAEIPTSPSSCTWSSAQQACEH